MISLLMIAAHMLGDYILQNDWMAANKLNDQVARSCHVTIYTAGFLPIVLYAHMTLFPACYFLFSIWLTHYITDSRRWASGDKWPPKPILVDQSIHMITLAIIGVAFGL